MSNLASLADEAKITLTDWKLNTTLGVVTVFGRVVEDRSGERKPYDWILVRNPVSIEFSHDPDTASLLFTADDCYLLEGNPAR